MSFFNAVKSSPCGPRNHPLRRCTRTLLLVACSLAACFVESLRSQRPTPLRLQTSIRQHLRHCHGRNAALPLYTLASSSSSIEESFNVQQQQQQQEKQPWLDKALLLSSFSDGLKSQPAAQEWLCDALVERLWKDEQQSVFAALQNSNLASPCNGPDPTIWQQLEEIDQAIAFYETLTKEV